ncbi:MAG TPA: hypothetical protein VH393_00600 [Ktedonobacterales bacterium]|jgi:hypothetical protein
MPLSLPAALIAGFLAGVVFSLLVALVARLFRTRSGPFSGAWEQQVADGRGGLRAMDRIEARQRGTSVEARIRRRVPTVEDYKTWRFSGHVEGPLLSGVIWSEDAQKTPATYATVQIAIVDTARAEGFISHRQIAQNGGRFIETALQSPLVWTRPGATSERPAEPAAAS